MHYLKNDFQKDLQKSINYEIEKWFYSYKNQIDVCRIPKNMTPIKLIEEVTLSKKIVQNTSKEKEKKGISRNIVKSKHVLLLVTTMFVYLLPAITASVAAC